MVTSLKEPHDPKHQLARVLISQGAIAFLLLVILTIARRETTGAVLLGLGNEAWIIGLIFVLTAVALQNLRFELARDLHVALGITAYVAMYPLLGVVLSAWIGPLSAILGRLLSIRREVAHETRFGVFARLVSFFATYGIPIAIAGLVYEGLGGLIGRNIAPTWSNVGLLTLGGLILIVTNSLVMLRPGRAMGLSWPRIARLYSIDMSIYILTLPFSIIVTMSLRAFGIVGVVALLSQLVMAFYVTMKMARAQNESRQLLQRLASLTNIGRAISLTTTNNLLMTVYTECKKVIDTTIFSIALLDDKTEELTLELLIRDDEILAKQRIPAGEGLNAWVVENHAPLLLGRHGEEEKVIGVTAYDDGLVTQSWLGVPMIARDRVIGVIAVQSYNEEEEFTRDDVLLLTAVANQAAVAIDNAKLYEELEDLTYALEERVQERTNELRETNLQLMAADRAKNEFLAKMSHELRTPLNSIIGFSSVLQQSPPHELSPRLAKFLDNIHAAGHHLLNLINDILDLSKIEAGKVELRLDTFDLRDTVLSVERVMKGFADEASVKIETAVDRNVPLVTLDEGRLKQILFNLLSNAVKFSPDGGPVSLHISRVAHEHSPIHRDSVRIEVTDNGLGIPQEDLGRIFDEFYQSDHSRAAKLGTGLGLSLTKNFVELHHGTIEVRSRPGTGSTFTMYLPINCRDAGVVPAPRLYDREDGQWMN